MARWPWQRRGPRYSPESPPYIPWAERLAARQALGRAVVADPDAGTITIRTAALALVQVLTADDAPAGLPRKTLRAITGAIREGTSPADLSWPVKRRPGRPG